MKEKILCAAVWYNDGGNGYIHQPFNIKSGYVVCGRRHHNCITIHSMLKGLAKKPNDFLITQGFLTNNDRFVDRKEGWKIALEAGQIINLEKITDREDQLLFSENLY